MPNALLVIPIMLFEYAPPSPLDYSSCAYPIKSFLCSRADLTTPSNPPASGLCPGRFRRYPDSENGAREGSCGVSSRRGGGGRGKRGCRRRQRGGRLAARCARDWGRCEGNGGKPTKTVDRGVVDSYTHEIFAGFRPASISCQARHMKWSCFHRMFLFQIGDWLAS